MDFYFRTGDKVRIKQTGEIVTIGTVMMISVDGPKYTIAERPEQYPEFKLELVKRKQE